MKNFIYMLMFLGVVHQTVSQKRIEKTISVESGQKVEMDFKYPELINISTWDKSEIEIVALVSINQGENNDAFELIDSTDETVRISSNIKDFKNLPEKITLKYQGEEYYFNTSNWNSPEIRKFKADKGGDASYEYMYKGVRVDITIQVKVPKDIVLEVYSKHGLVEVVGFTKDMEIDSKFGGIDVSMASDVSAALSVRTKFGEVYSNLDTEFISYDNQRIGHWITMEGQLSNGKSAHSFRSEFGNVYLRKM